MAWYKCLGSGGNGKGDVNVNTARITSFDNTLTTDSNGYVTNNSVYGISPVRTNGLVADNIVIDTTKSWSIGLKFLLTSLPSDTRLLIGNRTASSYYLTPSIEVSSGGASIIGRCSTDGTSWTHSLTISSQLAIDTWYYAELSWNGTDTLSFVLKSDSGTVIDTQTTSLSSAVNFTGLLGLGCIHQESQFIGSMAKFDIENCSIKNNGTEIWNVISDLAIVKGKSAPVSSMGNNGQIYLQTINGERQDLSSFSTLIESTGSMKIDKVTNVIKTQYLGGQTIGAQAYKQIDLTNIDAIQISVKTTSPSYDNYATARFSPILLIENTINPASDYPALTSIVSANGETYRVTTQGDSVTFDADVSGLTGNYWIVLSVIGVTAEWSDLYLCGSTYDEVVYDTFAKSSGAWQSLIDTEVKDIIGVKEIRTSLYSLDQSQGGAWVDTGISVSGILEFLFVNSVSGTDDWSKTVQVSDIPVYTSGGSDVFLTVFSSALIGYDFNVRIYNGNLYVSYNGTGANTKVVTVYAGGLEL